MKTVLACMLCAVTAISLFFHDVCFYSILTRLFDQLLKMMLRECSEQSVLELDMFEVVKMGKCNDLSNSDEGQMVMAR